MRKVENRWSRRLAADDEPRRTGWYKRKSVVNPCKRFCSRGSVVHARGNTDNDPVKHELVDLLVCQWEAAPRRRCSYRRQCSLPPSLMSSFRTWRSYASVHPLASYLQRCNLGNLKTRFTGCQMSTLVFLVKVVWVESLEKFRLSRCVCLRLFAMIWRS